MRARVTATMTMLFLVSLTATTVPVGAAKYWDIGTPGDDDTQIRFGTPENDIIVQLGFGGRDMQYVEGKDGNDTIVQMGGTGDDSQTIEAGIGDDRVIQWGEAEAIFRASMAQTATTGLFRMAETATTILQRVAGLATML